MMHCRKNRTLAQRLRAHTSKAAWLLVVVLLGGMWYLHSHRTALSKDLEHHKNEKSRLEEHVSALGEHIQGKTRELREAQRAVTTTTTEVRARLPAVRWRQLHAARPRFRAMDGLALGSPPPPLPPPVCST
jgi:hypothetical protein